MGLAGSLSARRAWIEITSQVPTWFGIPVALRKESVDRNAHAVNLLGKMSCVALRKESVDRNLSIGGVDNAGRVALRKESVDRNMRFLLTLTGFTGSLSARRAWIEI